MITYYSDLKTIKDINNPLINNNVQMRHVGFFENSPNLTTPYFATSLTKTIQNKAMIYCANASKLFSINTGYVSLLLSFPASINNGVYSLVRNSDKKYLLWGVNMGQTDIENPGIGAFLSNNGIEFSIKTLASYASLIDDTSSIQSNVFFKIEFIWDKDGIAGLDSEITMALIVNDEIVASGAIAILDDLNVSSAFYSAIGQTPPSGTSVFYNVPFYFLDNIYGLNNISCSVSRIIIGDLVPQSFLESL